MATKKIKKENFIVDINGTSVELSASEYEVYLAGEQRDNRVAGQKSLIEKLGSPDNVPKLFEAAKYATGPDKALDCDVLFKKLNESIKGLPRSYFNADSPTPRERQFSKIALSVIRGGVLQSAGVIRLGAKNVDKAKREIALEQFTETHGIGTELRPPQNDRYVAAAAYIAALARK